jgi:outer membrane protein
MSKVSGFFLAVVFALAVHSAQAQEPGKKTWTLKECVDYALRNNLTVQRGVLTQENSGINARQAKLTMLPSLNTGSSYGFNWGRSIDPTTNLFRTQEIQSLNVNASASLLLFNGFRVLNQFKQSQADLNASAKDLEKAQNDVILNVVTLYMNVIFNKELFTNAQSQLASTTQQLERTRKLAEAGSVPRGNVLDLEAQEATNELNVINRENGVNLSLLQLKQALQLPGDSDLDVEVPQIDITNELILDQSAQEIYRTALGTMPEIESARLKVQSSDLGVRVASGGLYPRLSVNGNFFTNYSNASRSVIEGDPVTSTVPIGYVQGTGETVVTDIVQTPRTFGDYAFTDQINDNISRAASLSLQIPIFNGFSANSNLQRARITRQVAEINARQTENTLRQAVETSFNDAVAASKTYNSSLKQVQARDEAFRMTKQRFDNGAVNYVDYQIAENNLFQARSDLVRAKYDFIFKKKVLDFFQGKPLDL